MVTPHCVHRQISGLPTRSFSVAIGVSLLFPIRREPREGYKQKTPVTLESYEGLPHLGAEGEISQGAKKRNKINPLALEKCHLFAP
jgi:hypothetical protein